MMTTKPRPTLDEARTDVYRALAGLLNLLLVVGAAVALACAVPFLRWALGV
jgi:hypothetical protein